MQPMVVARLLVAPDLYVGWQSASHRYPQSAACASIFSQWKSRCEETLRDRIIPAISLATHAGDHAECAERVAEIIAGVLTAAVGMKQRAERRRFEMAGIAKRIEHQLIGHPIAEAVPEHLAGLQGDDHRQVQPALASRNVGDIARPGVHSCIDAKAPLQGVRGNGALIWALSVVRGTKRPIRKPRRPSSRITRRTRFGITHQS